jgi:hypothetical protein
VEKDLRILSTTISLLVLSSKNSVSTIKDPINGVSLPNIEVEGIVCKSDNNVGLPGKDMGDI